MHTPPLREDMTQGPFSSGVYIYEVHTISFQAFFVWAFKIVVDS